MINLSDRLLRIGHYINAGETMADIGTDHGKLPLYLLQHGISPRVIACDIGYGPLDKARATASLYSPDQRFEPRLGDGLEPVASGEVDDIVIAGMGGSLICSILAKHPAKTASFQKYVFQPRNAKDKLRKWLLEHHFTIIDEDLVREGKYFCEIIVAVPFKMETAGAKTALSIQYQQELSLEVSPILFHKKHPLLVPFLKNKLAIEERILRSINSGKTSAIARRSAQNQEPEHETHTKRRIESLQKLIDQAERSCRDEG